MAYAGMVEQRMRDGGPRNQKMTGIVDGIVNAAPFIATHFHRGDYT